MSISEKEPYDCMYCGWSGHNPKRISWDDQVLHHGDRMNYHGHGSNYHGQGSDYHGHGSNYHGQGSTSTGSYGSYRTCPECGRRVLTASRREWERRRDKAIGYIALGVLAIFAVLLVLEAVL